MAIIIRSYHLDGYGHVNNARYLEFLEEARWTFFESNGLSDMLDDIQMVVSRIDIRYRRAATEGDVLHACTSLAVVQPRQVLFRQAIVFALSGKTAVEAEVALMSVRRGKAASLPEGLRLALFDLCESE